MSPFADKGSYRYRKSKESKFRFSGKRHALLPDRERNSGSVRYVGASGRVVSMETFGASAPLKALPKKFTFEPKRVFVAARQLLSRG